MSDSLESRLALNLAARVASRGVGNVEPNPLVGAVIVRPGSEPFAQRILGIGHHRRLGNIHAEVDALNNARSRNHNVHGCTMYVTLEPCAHTGHNPPCTRAIIDAQVAAVVIARKDPNPIAAGGASILAAAGISVSFSDASPAATHLSDPFIHRVTTHTPWIIAKWAQSIDGKLATRTGDSQWISGPLARRRVHRLRGCVDAIITGPGTVFADDPLLTARDAPTRRRALRIVIDRDLSTITNATTTSAIPAIYRDQSQFPTIILAANGPKDSASAAPPPDQVRHAESLGVQVLLAPARADRPAELDLAAALAIVAQHHPMHTVLLEAGPGLLGSFLRQRLVNECLVFTAPVFLGDPQAAGLDFAEPYHMADAEHLDLLDTRRIGDDVQSTFRLAAGGAS